MIDSNKQKEIATKDYAVAYKCPEYLKYLKIWQILTWNLNNKVIYLEKLFIKFLKKKKKKFFVHLNFWKNYIKFLKNIYDLYFLSHSKFFFVTRKFQIYILKKKLEYLSYFLKNKKKDFYFLKKWKKWK